MTTNSTSHLGRFAKGALLVSAAFPLSALIAAGSASAAQTVEVSTSDTSANVQADINKAVATPDADITITVTSKGEVTGGGTIGLDGSAVAGEGDGKIVFGNAGSIGAVDKAGAVTDSVGVDLGGSPAKAGNTLTATNSGLITGGFFATDFGGTASLDNSGTIYNGVVVHAYGDASLKSSGAVRSGNVTVKSDYATTTKVDGDTKTTTYAGGNASAVVGDVASADGKAKGDVYVEAQTGTVEITANGTAGNVAGVAVSGGATEVETNSLPVADKSVTTYELTRTYEATSVTIDTAATSNLTSVTGVANGDVDISVAGSVDGNVTAQGLGSANTTAKIVQLRDGTNTVDLQRAETDSGSAVAGNATIDLAKTAEVGGGVSANATRDASIVTAGSVKGGLTAIAGGGTPTYSNSVVTTKDDTDALLKIVTAKTSETVASVATIEIAEGASVGSDVLAAATGDASATNDGAVTGTVTVAAGNGKATTYDQTQVYDGKGNLLSNAVKSTETVAAGNASIVFGATGSATGNVTAVASNDASVENEGSIGGSLIAVAGKGTSTVDDFTDTFDAATGSTTSDTLAEYSDTQSAGSVTVVNAEGAKVDGKILATATRDISITNAGTVGGGVTAGSSANDYSESHTYLYPTTVVDAVAGTETTTTSEVWEETSTNATGAVDFTNVAGAVVGFNGTGNVNLTAGGDITILNQGDVRGTTTATSSSSTIAHSGTYETKGVVVTKDKSGTYDEKWTNSDLETRTGGSVTGTYAGANGTTNFAPGAIGNVSQTAELGSTVTVTGAIFGNVSSVAGSAGYATSSHESAGSEATVQDGAGTGTFTGEYTESWASTPTVGGDSKVDISGRVAVSNVGGTANVRSEGTNSSTVTISGSVAGDVSSDSFGTETYEENVSHDFAQTLTKFVAVTDTANEAGNETVTIADGASSVSITGKGSAATPTVGGSVNVNGVTSGSVSVAAASVVGGNVSVDTNNGFDFDSSYENAYVRDAATGVATATSNWTATDGAAAAQGNAQATVAGVVLGSTEVYAGRGDATVTLTGVSAGGVTAVAGSSVTTTTGESVRTGKSSSSSTDYSTLEAGLAAIESTVTEEETALGGKATVVIDTAAALQAKGIEATSNVYADGLSGASVTVTKGSIVTGDIEAYSYGADTVRVATVSNDGKGTVNRTESLEGTIVGGPATVTNAGAVGGSVFAQSATSATVSNTGRIEGNAVASGVVTGTNWYSEVTKDGIVAAQTETVTVTPVIGLAKASVTNAAGAVIAGDVGVAGGEGTVTNNGIVAGTTVLGVNLDTASVTSVYTDTTTDETVTPAADLLTQTYVANQNSVSGGFAIVGGLDTQGLTQTSDVKATINLNSGSVTLGDIIGEVDADGNRTTDTTVNLVGSGYLGADEILYPNETWPISKNKPNPLLSLGKDAAAEFGASDYAVRVIGVETLNKEGAGTFVINGAGYQPAAPGVPALYTLDVGNFNINAGEVQLNVDGDVFGVRGNINNAATLVIGRRLTPARGLFGENLVGQTELIDGITIAQVGDYNQTAAGTTVVGITPSLIRVYNPDVSVGSGASELLGPVLGGVDRGYFTTPTLLGIELDPSRVDITGNLNLAGKVAVNVYRDSLYANGDGYTLFTYTGTGAVTAAAAPTLTSPYVGFTLVHDTAKKEVRLEVKRNSYGNGATNPNAVAAAVGLDSALSSVISRIRTDATGGAGFASVTELGYAQDIANVATALDFRLSSDQAAQLFNELSSGEIYGSLAAVDQNAVFGQTLDMLTNRRSFGGDFATQLWINPVGNWGRFGDGDAYGASDIRANSYGLAGGLDFAYAADGAFGFGGSYAEHDISARGTPESVDGSTWTVGAYVTQGFGPIYANAKLAYGWTNYDASRTMSLLARTAEASINAKQLDFSLELGYDYRASGVTVTPFGKLVLRRSSLEGFTETEAGAFSLAVDSRKKTVLSPVLGVKLGTEAQVSDSVLLRPFAKASYTFQGDLPNDVSVRYVGGGDKFILRGAEPDSYGMFEAGFEARIADRLNFFVTGSQTFGGDNKVTGLRGGVTIQF